MLYLITNRKIINRGNFYEVLIESLRGGVDAIILREKDLDTDELLPMAYKLRNITASFSSKLIVNSNPFVSKAVNADYFHSGISSFDKDNMLYGAPFGLSTHSVSEVKRAKNYGASYVLLSHIFPTKCKKNIPPKSLDLIVTALPVGIPLIALGGINKNNVSKVVNHGANGIAVMSYIMSSEDPYKSTLELKHSIKIGLSPT